MDSTNNGVVSAGSVLTSTIEPMITTQTSTKHSKRAKITDCSSDCSSDTDLTYNTVTNGRGLSKGKRKKLTINTKCSNQATVLSSLDVNTSSQLSKSAAIDEAIERVLSQSRSDSTVVSDTETTREIKELRLIINRQNSIIENVVSRLNFILTMFNIEEVSMDTLCSSANNSNEASSICGTLPVNQWPALPSQSATDHQAGQSIPVINNTSTKQSYSTVASQPKETQKQFTKLRQSLVAAVYIDQRDRDNRSSSFIISGLPTSADRSDTSIVKELCLNEFHVDIDIVNTKRLGKTSTSTTSSSSSMVKVQPVLVNVRNAEHAKLIITSARRLRQSAVHLIRENVFINPNLAKADFFTATYELRCRYRQTAARRSTTGDHSVGHAAAINQQPSAIRSSSPRSMSVQAAVLNAAVPAFVPNATTSSSSS